MSQKSSVLASIKGFLKNASSFRNWGELPGITDDFWGKRVAFLFLFVRAHSGSGRGQCKVTVPTLWIPYLECLNGKQKRPINLMVSWGIPWRHLNLPCNQLICALPSWLGDTLGPCQVSISWQFLSVPALGCFSCRLGTNLLSPVDHQLRSVVLFLQMVSCWAPRWWHKNSSHSFATSSKAEEVWVCPHLWSLLYAFWFAQPCASDPDALWIALSGIWPWALWSLQRYELCLWTQQLCVVHVVVIEPSFACFEVFLFSF